MTPSSWNGSARRWPWWAPAAWWSAGTSGSGTAAQATAVVLRGQPIADGMAWLKVLLAFDLVFVSACIVVFPFTIEE